MMDSKSDKIIPLKGEIWLANLNPSKKSNEIGKVRPVLIFQNDELNKSSYPTTIIIPLTTSLIDDAQPLRYRIDKKNNLNQDSDLLIAHIRAIDNNRLINKISELSNNDMNIIKKLLDEVLL
ncbi:MAG: type II toxin-antitoxin system PemK/MazF family toxin [Campylobacterota bacterium]|nr:type II toxin-antitoxin system PemK/MazF family toxin [Campylobacterota bacterium]